MKTIDLATLAAVTGGTCDVITGQCHPPGGTPRQYPDEPDIRRRTIGDRAKVGWGGWAE